MYKVLFFIIVVILRHVALVLMMLPLNFARMFLFGVKKAVEKNVPFDYRFGDFEPLPDYDLLCVICHSVAFQPVISPCKHLFCEDCIGDWLKLEKECPLCRKRLSAKELRDAGRRVRESIEKLTLTCPFQPYCSQKRILMKDFETHVQKCSLRMEKCKELSDYMMGLVAEMVERDRAGPGCRTNVGTACNVSIQRGGGETQM